MSNTQNQLWVHPDTGNNFFLAMEAEESDPIVNMTDVEAQKQAIRDLYTQYLAAQATKQAEFGEVRDAKLATALTTLNSDLTILSGSPTNAQVVAAVRHLLTVMIALVKIVARLV